MHKRITIFFFTLFFQNIFCMEIPTKRQKQHVPHQIVTRIKKPCLVGWLSQNRIFIGGANGFQIINLLTGKSIKKSSLGVYDFALNKSKTQYAVSKQKKITCYDAQTNKCLWQCPLRYKCVPITFNSQNEQEVILCGEFERATTLGRSTDHNILCFYSPKKTPISCHPKKEIVLFHRGNNICKAEECHLDERSLDTKGESIAETRYSSQGDYIVINFRNSLQIMTHSVDDSLRFENNPDQFIYESSTIATTSSSFVAFEYYNNSVIAALTEDNQLCYYDCYKKKLIAEVTLQFLAKKNIKELGKRLFFSPDCRQLLVALEDDCFIIPVTFDIQYWQGAEKILSIFYLLQPFSPVDKTMVNNKK